MQFAYAQEEFVGSFASWANVVTRFHAKGDGVTDDTRSLQQALNNLSNPVTSFNTGRAGYMVVYLPKGIYKITQTLELKGKIGVSFIGEDPANTIIRWAGKDNDTMLWANGSAYFKISRITFDANGKQNIEGIGLHWKNKWKDENSQSFAALNNEISDIVFVKTAIGISGGTSSEGTNNNDSEITIRRCTFIKCSETAIRIGGYNALNYWIWYCRFLECNVAINCRAGNYHVYNSFFKGSLLCDILHANSYYSSVRGSLSSESRLFSWEDGRSCNPFKRIFQGNTILSPEEIPIGYYHLGSVTMMDNTIQKSRKAGISEHLNMGSWCPGDYTTLSVNNNYGYSKPINLYTSSKKIYTFNDSIGKRIVKTETAFLRQLPPTPAKTSRKIFEVPANASASSVQKIINEALKLKGSRPVLHFGFGKWYFDKPLLIPAGSDIQLRGDGLLYASTLINKNGNPVLIIKGPSYVSIQDIQIGEVTGNKTSQPVILFENTDQPGSTVITDQLYSLADTTLFIRDLNHLYLEKNNSFFSSGNYISGGNLQRQGKGTLQVNCFGGQFANLTVLNNANFVAKDCWWEGPKGKALHLNGNGNVTIDGAMVAPVSADSSTVISVGDFTGNISLLNMYVQGALDVSAKNDRLNILAWNVHFYFKLDPLKFIQPKSTFHGLFFGLTAQCFQHVNQACKDLNPYSIPEKAANVSGTGDFIKRLTQATRTSIPRLQQKSKPGISNIYISRITLGMANKGIEFINR